MLDVPQETDLFWNDQITSAAVGELPFLFRSKSYFTPNQFLYKAQISRPCLEYDLHLHLCRGASKYIFSCHPRCNSEDIVIGLALSATFKGHQVKTTEPIVSTKLTNCKTFRFNFKTCDFAKNYIFQIFFYYIIQLQHESGFPTPTSENIN